MLVLILLYSLVSQFSAISHFTKINVAKHFLSKYIHSTSNGFPADRFSDHQAKTKRYNINKSNSIYKNSI